MSQNVIIYPDGIGNSDNWTLGSGTSKTTAVQSNDGDTSYIYDNSATQVIQLFTMTNPTLPTGAIIEKIQVNIVAKYIDRDAAIKVVVRTDSNNYFGSEEALTASYATYSNEWTENPYTSSAWTVSEVNSIECGIATSGTSTYDRRCTLIYARIYYYMEKDLAADGTVQVQDVDKDVVSDGAVQIQDIDKDLTSDGTILIEDIDKDVTSDGAVQVQDNDRDVTCDGLVESYSPMGLPDIRPVAVLYNAALSFVSDNPGVPLVSNGTYNHPLIVEALGVPLMVALNGDRGGDHGSGPHNDPYVLATNTTFLIQVKPGVYQPVARAGDPLSCGHYVDGPGFVTFLVGTI